MLEVIDKALRDYQMKREQFLRLTIRQYKKVPLFSQEILSLSFFL